MSDYLRPQAGVLPADLSRAFGDRLTLGCYALTLLLSASLLFTVQPMLGKALLPVLGGTPAVWNTCMVFFQAMLLAGYGYAHLSTRWLGVRRQAALHLLVLLAPLAVLPLAVQSQAAPPTTGNPTGWLLWRLFVAAGLPFFAISATAPLLQKWFAQSGHPSAEDPYFLYAASNAGSLFALLAYPLLLEPRLALAAQSDAWAGGYYGLTFLIMLCALCLWWALDRRNQPTLGEAQEYAPRQAPETSVAASTGDAAALGLRARAWWIFLAFVPSSLMLGVTTHITTDLATVPLLWVVPLALYLLSFVFVFARRQWIPPELVQWLYPFALLPLTALLFLSFAGSAWLVVPIHLGVFFLAAMLCHGRLAMARPATAHLTEFYFWMSVGGVLGGLFNAVVAPLLFSAVIEYPLVLALSCLALPVRRSGSGGVQKQPPLRRFVAHVAPPACLLVIAVGLAGLMRNLGACETLAGRLVIFGLPMLVCFAFSDVPIRFALGIGGLCLANALHDAARTGELQHMERNFYGVKRVVTDPQGGFRLLIHGGIRHGSQALDPAAALTPTAYYARSGPIGDVFAALADRADAEIAVVGLGVGTVACYAEQGRRFTFYEIDPGVAEIASDPQYFTYLDQRREECRIVLGDGRLTLSAAPAGHYDLILLDAFSSDAIPTHLLTREALQLYLEKLAPDGLLAFHISNQYLDLRPLLAALAADAGLACRVRVDSFVSVAEAAQGKLPSAYVLLAHHEAQLGTLMDKAAWQTWSGPHARIWTDQYSNIFSLIRWRQ